MQERTEEVRTYCKIKTWLRQGECGAACSAWVCSPTVQRQFKFIGDSKLPVGENYEHSWLFVSVCWPVIDW